MNTEPELILVLSESTTSGRGLQFEIYKYKDTYTLVYRSGTERYFNDGRRVNKEFRTHNFIFEADVGKGKKERIEISKWSSSGDKVWRYASYYNDVAFRYSDEDEWTLQDSRACIRVEEKESDNVRIASMERAWLR